MLQRFENLLAERQAYGPLLLRAVLGIVFIAHGLVGLFVYTPAGVAQGFAALGIPLPALNAWVVLLVHLLGGTMLLTGFYTRLNGLLHAGVMAVALLTAHVGQGFFMKGIILDAASGTAMAGGYEFVLVLAVASLSLLFTGGGAWALDNLRGRAPAPVTRPRTATA